MSVFYLTKKNKSIAALETQLNKTISVIIKNCASAKFDMSSKLIVGISLLSSEGCKVKY